MRSPRVAIVPDPKGPQSLAGAHAPATGAGIAATSWLKRFAARGRAILHLADRSASKTVPAPLAGANAPDMGAGGDSSAKPQSKPSKGRPDGRLRCLVICVSRAEDIESYRELARRGDNEGTAVFDAVLLSDPLTHSIPSPRPRQAAAKRDPLDTNRKSPELFWLAWQSGEINLPYWPCTVKQAYRAYLKWSQRNGDLLPLKQNIFTRLLLRISEAEGNACRGKIMKLADDRGVKKSERMLIPIDPPDKNQGSWASQCRGNFEKELSKYIGGKSPRSPSRCVNRGKK